MREAKTTRRTADKLVGVTRCDGTPVWVLIHVEVQGDPETPLPSGCSPITTGSCRRDTYQVPVASLAVLADADRRLPPNAVQHRALGCRDRPFSWTRRSNCCTTPERWAELEASDNVFGALVVMAQIRAKVTRCRDTAQALAA